MKIKLSQIQVDTLLTFDRLSFLESRSKIKGDLITRGFYEPKLDEDGDTSFFNLTLDGQAARKTLQLLYSLKLITTQTKKRGDRAE